MTTQALNDWQTKFEEWIYDQARTKGLITDDVEPVCDGVIDFDEYLSSDLKVAWLLKEPYDEFDAQGKPCGGGWSFRDGFSDHDENWIKPSGYKLWANPVWQKIAYIMYGYLNGRIWKSLPWMRDKPQMMCAINSIAVFNVSKMPAWSNSSSGWYRQYFNDVWQDIVMKQLEVYDPDVVICGNTFDCLKPIIESELKLEVETSNDWVDHYKWGNRHLIDTYHPGRKGGAYVDAIIKVLAEIKRPY